MANISWNVRFGRKICIWWFQFNSIQFSSKGNGSGKWVAYYPVWIRIIFMIKMKRMSGMFLSPSNSTVSQTHLIPFPFFVRVRDVSMSVLYKYMDMMRYVWCLRHSWDGGAGWKGWSCMNETPKCVIECQNIPKIIFLSTLYRKLAEGAREGGALGVDIGDLQMK